MNHAPTPRTDMLLKVYIGLFALAIVLTAVLVQRHFGSSVRRDDGPFVAAAAKDTPRNYGPTINWGGAKR
jgi:hypothetical protein